MLSAIVMLALAIYACVQAAGAFFDRHMRWLGLGALGAVGLYFGFLLLFTGCASAATADGSTADLRPLWGYGVEIAGGVLGALGGFGLRALTRFLRLKEDGLVRHYLDDAMHRALSWAVEQAVTRGDDMARIEVRSRLLADAASYAAATVPDALRRFGIGEAGLKQRLEARLGEWAPHPDQPITGRVISSALLGD